MKSIIKFKGADEALRTILESLKQNSFFEEGYMLKKNSKDDYGLVVWSIVKDKSELDSICKNLIAQKDIEEVKYYY